MPRRLRRLVAGLAPALVLVACTAGPGASSSAAGGLGSGPSPSAVTSAAPSSEPTAGPSDGSGVAGGNPGAGVTPIPMPGGPGASGGAIPVTPPIVVTPTAGLHDVHDVRAEAVTAALGSASHLVATVTWWSGPAPCAELAAVQVHRTGNAFTLTVQEGAAQLGIACPALATHKQAAVDLGVVASGTYTVAATGATVAATVTVPAG